MLKNLFSLLDYFLVLPVISLFPLPLAYQLGRFRGRFHARWDHTRTALARKSVEDLLGKSQSPIARRYQEVHSCDELDAYLFLVKPFHQVAQFIHVEGAEYVHEVKHLGKGVILLGAHLGGALFLNPFLRSLGVQPQLIMRPVVKEEFPSLFSALYLYSRFRSWCVTRAVGAPPLLSGRGVEEAIEAVRQGTFLWIALDVPPYLTGRTTQTDFFGQPARFPYGPFIIAARAEAPIVPFFSSLDDNNQRTFRFLPPIWPSADPYKMEETFHCCVQLLEQEIRTRPEQWFFWEDPRIFFEPSSQEDEMVERHQ
ncbi:MAG: lysophospholipid acyltransferase family protein [Deltaproteobacteria bacterium]|nr:lysophospholipid acyltransferase family protein [Deltaproteobacteria bacterium]